ncbi:hypothetical protein [Cryobacterium sp. PH31-L1]|uniref:hypothetical protein n=1 Tax=Cryobacterium sp. PH31-L1 TaxID=3046199 RepID=UPI0024B8FEEC|nr:hypothetical protein [Cryobacterium sp. PH31-L1]MDJ0378277.1 hypothetical protein [Cryobacterium sp. PH31-L1]
MEVIQHDDDFVPGARHGVDEGRYGLLGGARLTGGGGGIRFDADAGDLHGGDQITQKPGRIAFCLVERDPGHPARRLGQCGDPFTQERRLAEPGRGGDQSSFVPGPQAFVQALDQARTSHDLWSTSGNEELRSHNRHRHALITGSRRAWCPASPADGRHDLTRARRG